MRIFIKTFAGNNFTLDVESFDTIGCVKELIGEKEGSGRSDHNLLWKGFFLKDWRTVADYDIKNDSIIHMLHSFGGGMQLLINTFPDKTFSLLVVPSDTINDLKARIHVETGIPVNGQRLLFAGEELDNGDRTLEDCGIGFASTLRLVRLRGHGDDAVDIGVVQARRKAALSKGNGVGNQAEIGSERGFSSRGANRVEGVESFWDEEDFGLAWRRSRSLISSYDALGFESKSYRALLESVANDCVRTLNVTDFLERQLNKYEERLSESEKEVKRLSDENAGMMDEMKRMMQELVMERSTGASFLKSEAGRRHIVSLKRQAAKAGVDDFKESPAFKEIVMNRSMSVYDDVVKECQRLLRKSGRVSEDVIKIIDAVDSEQYEGEGEKAYSKKLKQQLNVERSTGSSFLQSEVGRRYIVSLQRQAAKSGVEEFKESPALKEIVMNRAMSVYDEVVKECQKLLRESGRVSEDIIQLLDQPQDSDQGNAPNIKKCSSSNS